LYNNYVQALEILNTLPAWLEPTKVALNIPSNETFHTWQLEEKTYLASLKSEPDADIFKMEYLCTLCKCKEAKSVLLWSAIHFDHFTIIVCLYSDSFTRMSLEWLATPASELQRQDFYT